MRGRTGEQGAEPHFKSLDAYLRYHLPESRGGGPNNPFAEDFRVEPFTWKDRIGAFVFAPIVEVFMLKIWWDETLMRNLAFVFMFVTAVTFVKYLQTRQERKQMKEDARRQIESLARRYHKVIAKSQRLDPT